MDRLCDAWPLPFVVLFICGSALFLFACSVADPPWVRGLLLFLSGMAYGCFAMMFSPAGRSV